VAPGQFLQNSSGNNFDVIYFTWIY